MEKVRRTRLQISRHKMSPLERKDRTRADMTVLQTEKCMQRKFSLSTAVCHSGSLSGAGTLSWCQNWNPSHIFPSFSLSLPLPIKLAQVPRGHKGDDFKLIITSIHYRGSWIYSWVHFLITWFCIENYSLMFSTCNSLRKSLITLRVSR